MHPSVTWDPNQYGRYAALRLRPALDLLAGINHPDPREIHDLGCGTGEVTRLLADRWPSAAVTGSDLSTEMLAVAAREPSGISWQELDITDWQPPAPVDIVYSNAAIHWVGAHRQLIPRLAASLAPGGVLAIQMPLSWHGPSHRLMREVLATGGPDGGPLGTPPLRDRMAIQPVGAPADYYDLLAPWADSVDIWETRYHQVLSGDDPVLEWVSGTALRPILEGLPEDELERFLHVYAAALRDAYPARPTGETFFPFPRLFIVASAPAG